MGHPVYNIHQLHAFTTNRMQVAKALCLDAPVASVPRLPITLAGALNTEHQSTIASGVPGQKHPGDTTHKIGNCGRNSPEMSQGAKTNENSWTTQPPLVTACRTLQLLEVSSQSHGAKHELHNTSITPLEFHPGNRSRVKRSMNNLSVKNFKTRKNKHTRGIQKIRGILP